MGLVSRARGLVTCPLHTFAPGVELEVVGVDASRRFAAAQEDASAFMHGRRHRTPFVLGVSYTPYVAGPPFEGREDALVLGRVGTFSNLLGRGLDP